MNINSWTPKDEQVRNKLTLAKLNVYIKFKTTIRAAWAAALRDEEEEEHEGVGEEEEENPLKITSCGVYLSLRAFEALVNDRTFIAAVEEAKTLVANNLPVHVSEDKFEIVFSRPVENTPPANPPLEPERDGSEEGEKNKRKTAKRSVSPVASGTSTKRGKK